MRSRTGFYIVVAVVGLLLLLAPFVIRTTVLNYDGRSYTPPAVPPTSMAVTPAPTITPMIVPTTMADPEAPLRTGPVIVDLAHFNRLNRSSFQPLAAALAERNVGLRFWLPEDINVLDIQSFADFPDQSETLAAQLADASGLVVASPFFLWNEQEIAVVEAFIADGGRLVLISDPDIVGDVARDINNLAEPFGVVFNDDYLYDTTENDNNFTHIFVTDFLDSAEDLNGSTIAFYGARSIDGSGVAQTRTGETTVSSLRAGLSGFATVMVAGLESNNSAGRVLALSDFDLLTEPYVTRFDNRLMVEHLTDFLAGGARGTRLVDFPAFLGKDVSLVYGSAESVDSALLELSSQLQVKLESTGRLLTLTGAEAVTGTQMLSGTGSLSPTASIQNLIYVSDFETTQEQTTLLDEFGVEIIEVIETPTPAPSDTPTPTATATGTDMPTPTPSATPTETSTPTPSATREVTGTVTPEPTATQTSTATPTATATETATVTPTPTVTQTPTPTPTPTPKITVLLEAEDGLRYLATETLVFLQQTGDDAERLVAVLGKDEAALSAGMERLLKNDFANCITHDDLVICPYKPATEEISDEEGAGEPSATEEGSAETLTATPVPEDDGGGAQPIPRSTMDAPEATPTAETEDPGAPGESDASVLIIDDNDDALTDESGEIHTYVTGLAKARVPADTWSIQLQGMPTGEDVAAYQWIIWSAAGYAAGGPGVQDLALIMDFLNEGGSVTISSRTPFFGQTDEPATTIVDVETVDGVPALVVDLPSEAVELAGVMPAVSPLSNDFEGDEADLVLQRGPASEDAGKPISFVLTDEDSDDPQGAQLLIVGMSLSWLPQDFADTFVANMADWMLEE